MDIKGYRQLSNIEIEMINALKKLEKEVLHVIDNLTGNPLPPEIDKRWLSIGKTHIEEGFMAMVRSIAKPE